MNSKSYFMLGCKLFGIYCLLMGIPALGGAITTFTSMGNVPGEVQQSYFVTNVVIRLIPVLFIGGGLYLLGGGKSIYNFAYPQEYETHDDFEEKFLLAIKIFGIYLIITYLPYLIRNISEFVTKMTAPSMFQVFDAHKFNITNTISNAAGFGLGLYLLRSGKFFIKYGLKKS